ncbi:hypothetical protein E8E12_000003, partial [Didymella heteroderae]
MYGICDEGFYNFDEASFMIGKTTTQLIVTALQRRGRPRVVTLVRLNVSNKTYYGTVDPYNRFYGRILRVVTY